MKSQNPWKRWILAAAAILVVALGAVAVFPRISQAASPLAAAQGPGAGGARGVDDTHLAAALGIPLEQLQAAREQARNAGIDQALAQGLITEAQAARLREADSRGLAMLNRFFGVDGAAIDQEALLAQALGITVEELEAAGEQARAAARAEALAAAVAAGRITQEEADLLQALPGLREFLAEPMQNAFDQALQQAVEAGVISQAQADRIASEGGLSGLHRLDGMRGGRGSFGHGPDGLRGRGGRGGFPGFRGLPNGSAPQGGNGLNNPTAGL